MNTFEQYLDNFQDLSIFCQSLLNDPPAFLAVDTEFFRETTYRSQLCLIQLAAPGVESIIDPLVVNLEPLLELLYHPKIVKVFHGARQDLEIFYQLTGEIPTPLFDTQVAAMALGFGESPSYQTLVRKILKKDIDKSVRYTDWRTRPLTMKQWHYALQDVMWIRDLYMILRSELLEKDRLHWIDDMMQDLQNPQTYAVNIDRVVGQIKGSGLLKGRQFGVLRALCQWRETKAQEQDQPRRFVISDNLLYELARRLPKKESDFKVIKKFYPEHVQKIPDFLRIIHETSYCQSLNIPIPKTPPLLLDYLKLLLKVCCETHTVSSILVANMTDLETIATQDQENCDALQGWRWEIFGQYAKALIEGRLALTFQEGRGQWTPLPF